MSSVYTQVINREIPGFFVYEDDNHAAILDIAPFTDGHTLVIPKEQSDSFDEMDPEKFTQLMAVAQKVAQHLKEALKAEKVIMMAYGYGVQHTHIHLVPVNSSKEFKDAFADHESGKEFEPDFERLAEVLEQVKLEA